MWLPEKKEKKFQKKFAESKKSVSLRPQNHFRFLNFDFRLPGVINQKSSIKNQKWDKFFEILEDKVVQGKKCTCQFEFRIIFYQKS